MKALVTGATGFLGRAVAERLLTGGYQVRGLVRPTSQVEPLKRLGVELCIGDLLDRASLTRATQGVDVVFHTAARANHWGPWQTFYDANVLGVRHLVEAMRDAGVSRLVHFSSFTVYGRQTGRVHEDMPRQKIGDPYVDSKVEGEELVLALARQHRLHVTVLRPTSAYGPHDPKWIPTVAENIRRGWMRILGSGRSVAPIIYRTDMAEAAVLAAERPAASGEILNISSGEPVTWSEFFTTLAQCLGTTLPRAHLPFALIYPTAAVLEVLWKLAGASNPPPALRFGVRLLTDDWRVDISKAQRLLGWRPTIQYPEGLRRTVEWLRAESGPTATRPSAQEQPLDVSPVAD